MQNRQFITLESSWSQHKRANVESSIDAFCLQVVDLGLASIVFITPLLLGGRHPLGRFALVALCGLISLAWFIRQAIIAEGRWTRTGAVWLLLLAVGVVTLQVVSLPSEWLEDLSPRIGVLLPLWTQDTTTLLSLGSWNTLSLAPAETRLAIATLVAYGLLFFTASQRLRTVEDVQRVISCIALSALVVAVFGIVQYFTSNGLFFWFYEYPYSNTSQEVKGSFTCRNHFAHFLVLGTAPLIACVLSRSSARGNQLETSQIVWSSSPMENRSIDPSTVLLGLSTLIIIAAVFFSLSRGGALALGVTLTVLGGIYLCFKLVKAADLGLLVSVGVVVLIAVVSFYGYDRVANRLDDFTAGSVEELDADGGRQTIWTANLAAIRSGWQVGSGAGTHRYIYPAFLTEPHAHEYTHAENSPLQIVTENGLPGAMLLAGGMLCCSVWCVGALLRCQTRHERLYAGAVTASLSASMVHSLVDFVWFVPACMAVTILLAVCALRLSQLSKPAEIQSRATVVLTRPAWIGMSVIVFLAGGWSTLALLAPARASLNWDRFQLATIAHKSVRGQKTMGHDELSPDIDQADRNLILYMTEELGKVVSANPQDGRAHLKLAVNLLRQFDLQQAKAQNQMTISQIRDAAIASQFSSSQELQSWLVRAFGQHSNLLYRALHHTKRAIRLCPLQGEAYTFLAELCFLEGCVGKDVNACIEQALIVGPLDSDVLFAAGVQWLAAGKTEQAFQIWKLLFRGPSVHQYRIVNMLADKIPATVFLQSFHPDSLRLSYLCKIYREVGTDQDLLAIEQYLKDSIRRRLATESSNNLYKLWRLLAHVQTELEHYQAALASLQTAYNLQPNDFGMRYELGQTLLQLGHFDGAESHFKWCLSRQPEHAGAKARLLEAGRQRVSQRLRPESAMKRF